MKKYILSLFVLVLLLIGAIAVKAASSNPVKGWAWSSNIGWISFNSTDGNTGTGGSGTSPASYGVTVNQTGAFSGYAWSSNLGWISFNSSDLNGCTGSTPATVSTSTGQVNGWVRVVSAMDGNNGWDGCVKLSEGTSGTVFPTKKTGVTDGTRGVMYDSSSERFKGYAWGSDVVGWIRFDPSLSSYLNVGCEDCGGGSTFTASCTASPTSVNISNGPQTVFYELNVSEPVSNVSWDGISSEFYDNNGAEVTYSSVGTYNQSVDFYVANEPASRTIQCSTVTVTNGTTPPPGGSCEVPLNAVACPSEPENSQTGVTEPTGTTRSLTNPTSCPNVDNLQVCNFTCASGYSLRAGQCVQASIDET